ncbi:NlpC/P60 domain protein [Sulfitobacter noctilucae]|uniref:C40 family peptidase n=1 Tax=Sulfitobacter noctilucae TaxID=1342302 RepID=UPI0004697A70|nr:NlpC/P60 family protein [Sulfitobacter noctilucae]KIN75322.1 NlpC/P60 domain protein [Sulfitobacter noctilucae]
MSDPRLTPDPALIDQRNAAHVTQPVTDLCRAPNGPRDRQMLYGDAVTLLHKAAGWAYVQAGKDGYCGFVRSDALGSIDTPTHRVTAPATHAYADADFKASDVCGLSLGSRVPVIAQSGRFSQTPLGYIPTVHLSGLHQRFDDPADVAQLFLGTPYLWGGNSRWGIDCSGLVQAALLACGIPCPGDSDMQMALGDDATDGYKRNDLMFWKGHVAMVWDKTLLIHATAFQMACVFEPIDAAIKRIQEQGDGPVTAHRRISRT